MKKNRLLSLLACLLLMLGFNVASAQTNTFTRSTCNPNLQGCVSTSITLKLTNPSPPPLDPTPISLTKTISSPSSVDFPTKYTKIKVTLGSYSSTGTYYLPTTTGDITMIAIGADGEGVGPYIIYITNTGSNTFTVSVSNTSL